MIEAYRPSNDAECEKPVRFAGKCRTQYRSDGDVRAFQKIRILPKPADLLEKTPFLKPNIVDGPYADVKEYLGTQFHLLREDFVAPLRSAIQAFRQLYLEGNEMHRGTLRMIEGVNFYEVARFDRPKQKGVPGTMGVLTLSWPDYGPVDWDRSTRLKSGCLLGFSNNNFKNVVFAVVSHRQTPGHLKKGVLFVEFLDIRERPSSAGTYLIVENSSAYFEAYRHNLKVLQSMNPACFPLQRYLVNAERTVHSPSLLKPNHSFSFEPILRKKASLSSWNSVWPPQELTILNDQQYKAVRSAFSRELCVIQGPPGTGKTFVALRIVEMLLLNRVSDRPIIVVCYTNHALDQFLEGMLPYTEDIVRVGGASKSESLKDFTLNQLITGSLEDKKLTRQLTRDREDCTRRLEQLSRGADSIGGEISLMVESLERLLRQNLITAEPFGDEVVASKKLAKGVKALDSQDRRRVEGHRFPVDEYLKGCHCDQRAKIRKSRARYRSWKQSASTLTKKSLLEKTSASLQKKIARIDCDLRRVHQKPRPHYASKKKRTDIVKSKRVVGITTTGAAKFNSFLTEAQPEIVIVEEAAEVLESHLLASLTPSTKQLILIGDHQQLQPSTAVHRLAKEFQMEVSMFERLVRNKIDFVKLQVQHRMRDEFLCLLVPHIYEDYHSHSNVDKYPDVRGIASNLFFMTHSHREVHDPRTHSNANTFEAEIVVRLAYHFLRNDYSQTEITILSTYRGQLEAIEQEITKFCQQEGFSPMKDVESYENGANGRKQRVVSRVQIDPNLPMSPFEGMRITTVDDYQGEENEIVIVSFVRSNFAANIGFMAKKNRVCVALSRAKHGLFCIGDIATLASASTLWTSIWKELSERSRIGEGLPLLCKTHRNRKIVRTATEFDEFSKHGCGETCSKLLPCGHVCFKACHTVDPTHLGEYRCTRTCGRIYPCGHLCPKVCWEECGPCLAMTMKTLACGHTVSEMCAERTLCKEMVRWVPSCGHSRIIPCALTKAENLLCGKPVNMSRPCGHKIQTSCDAVVTDDSCEICDIQKRRERHSTYSRS